MAARKWRCQERLLNVNVDSCESRKVRSLYRYERRHPPSVHFMSEIGYCARPHKGVCGAGGVPRHLTDISVFLPELLKTNTKCKQNRSALSLAGLLSTRL